MATEQTRGSKFLDAMIWGGGFAIGSLIVGGLLKAGWSAVTTKDDTDELDELEEAEDDT